MSIYLNGSKTENGYFNGTKVDRVYANGTLVYESTIYVAKPTVSGAYKYNGTAQKAVITGYNSDAMIMGGSTSGVSVGTYTVTFALKKGYAWADGTTDMLELTWTIATKAIAKPTVSGSYSYSSKSLNAVITGYDSASMTMSGTQSAISVGTYHIYFTPKEGYMWDDGTTDQLDYTWEILEVKKISAKPKVTGTYTYSGAVQSAAVEYDSETVVMSGTQSATDAGTYHIYFTPAEGYTWEDETTTKLDYTWIISKKPVAIPTAATTSFVYNGSAKTLQITGYDADVMDALGTSMKTDAGTYREVFDLKNDNYVWANGSTGSIVITWSIERAAVPIPTLSATSFAWVEGQKHTVTVEASAAASNGISAQNLITVSGTLTQKDSAPTVATSNLGTVNTVTFSLKDGINTKWADGSSNDKTVTWTTKWVTGTSHFLTDLYNLGWNSGYLTSYNLDVDWGGADQPYIRVAPAKLGYIYTKDTSFTPMGLHVTLTIETDDTSIKRYAALCLYKPDSKSFVAYLESTAKGNVTNRGTTLYGKTSKFTMSEYCAAIRTLFTSSSETTSTNKLYWRISRICTD